jgi:hypothetical protein
MKLATFALLLAAGLLSAQTAPAPLAAHIAAGSTNPVVAADGTSWDADRAFSGGNVWVVPGGSPLCAHLRFGSFTYTLAVSPGDYLLTIKMIEPIQLNPGGRVFNVVVNGTPLAHIDIADIRNAIGPLIPLLQTEVSMTFPVTSTDGNYTIQFVTLTRSAVVSAIGLDPVPTPAPPTPVVTTGPSVARAVHSRLGGFLARK